MRAIFGEVFSKISNGIFIGCLGGILVSWGLYEKWDTMMFVGITILAVGFILAVINEEHVIRKIASSEEENKKLKKRLKDRQREIEQLQDAVMYLTQDMEQVSKELKSKSVTIERFKKIKLSMLKDSKVWEDCER